MFKFKVQARAALLLLAAAAAAPRVSADPGQQAMAVVRDPQSGQLRPATAAEVRAMQAASAREQRIAPQQQQPAQPPTVRPDGVRSAFLGERGMVYSVVKRGPDGKLTRQCVHGDSVEHGHALPHSHNKEGNHE